MGVLLSFPSHASFSHLFFLTIVVSISIFHSNYIFKFQTLKSSLLRFSYNRFFFLIDPSSLSLSSFHHMLFNQSLLLLSAVKNPNTLLLSKSVMVPLLQSIPLLSF
ncbi:hypothetical protein Hanom_Chr11g01003571 [Helianthus anomalus]